MERLSGMIEVIEKQTGNIYKCLQWTGKNKLEFNQFGVTGTPQGRVTKTNCKGNGFIKNEKGVFAKIDHGDYIIIDYTCGKPMCTAYKENELNKQFRRK